jgi:bacillithiol biosynthesis cysteine-adding enzyme BshC
MEFNSARVPYRQTQAFSTLALDYIDQAAALRKFFSHHPSLQGIREAMVNRTAFPTDRKLLVEHFRRQYSITGCSKKVRDNIEKLASPDCFTVTTAHQNNLFTGPMYVIYKIIHAIRLAEHLNESFPAQHFVPVFYIGSEDADLEELDHIFLGGQKLQWQTNQKGAVGRMKVDKSLLGLINSIEGQLNVLPHGREITQLLRDAYREGRSIEEATFAFVDHLFGEFGLLVLTPDDPELKKNMIPVFREELLQRSSSGIVQASSDELAVSGYKVQVNPREINLFYLENDLRERIEWPGSGNWKVVNTGKQFDRDALLKELSEHPERFSPNVILRGIYQETVLPDVAFIGGGGELAYWLQLRSLFDHFQVPFPVLVLRNSYLLVEKKWKEKISSLGLEIQDFFEDSAAITARHVLNLRGEALRLNGSLTEIEKLYDQFRKQASAVDPTLEKHVEALRSRAVEKLITLEKKMVKAEKRKHSDQQRQILAIREKLFPGGGLQERHDNICYYYAKWGRGFLNALFTHALALEQEFTILEER